MYLNVLILFKCHNTAQTKKLLLGGFAYQLTIRSDRRRGMEASADVNIEQLPRTPLVR